LVRIISRSSLEASIEIETAWNTKMADLNALDNMAVLGTDKGTAGIGSVDMQPE
jgi:hypothetical protein